MPELPDLTVYVERLEATIGGKLLERIELYSPFVLRSVSPSPTEAEGRQVTGVRRLGKRIVLGLDNDAFIVIHLMIAGRLRWRPPGRKVAGRLGLAGFRFEHGTLYLTEAGTTRRASLHLVRGTVELEQHDRGGLEVLDADRNSFVARLRLENHTLKRTLADPRLFSGIGNAYSDEILHRARLSPVQLTSRLTDTQATALYLATQDTLREWIERLRRDAGETFPEEVTAFHPEMAVHGRFGLPCPDCGAAVQRIRYATNETNYCARCQTGGKLLADRALSRLLKKDWPKTLDD